MVVACPYVTLWLELDIVMRNEWMSNPHSLLFMGPREWGTPTLDKGSLFWLLLWEDAPCIPCMIQVFGVKFRIKEWHLALGTPFVLQVPLQNKITQGHSVTPLVAESLQLMWNDLLVKMLEVSRPPFQNRQQLSKNMGGEFLFLDPILPTQYQNSKQSVFACK